MTYAQLGDFRLATIYKLQFEGKDINKTNFIPTDILDNGIHLDARCADGEHWYAIASIRYDEDEDSYELRSVGPRLMERLNAENLEDVQYLVNYAYKLLSKEYAKRHLDED